jgi:cell division inhibitor SepF
MTSLFSKALVYLGLVDEESAGTAVVDDDYQDDVPAPRAESHRGVTEITPEGRRVEPPAAASRIAAVPRDRGTTVAGVRPIRGGAQADILVVEEFTDARILADRVRDRVPVVLDFRNVGQDLVRRVIDFSSGLIYALDGTMNKVGDGLVMVLPPKVQVTDDEKRRLAALGAYELDI